MPRELEDYPRKICDWNYKNACTGLYNKLDFSSFHIQDSEDSSLSWYEIPPNGELNGYQGAGDSHIMPQNVTDVIPCEEHVNELQDYDCYYDEALNPEQEFLYKNPVQELPWKSFAPLSSTYQSEPFARCDVKIRYTRQYLLNCQRSSLSTTFPDCLLKYVDSNEVPLRQIQQEDPFYDCRSMDHILFYKSLPYTRMKHTLGNGMRRKAVF